jgi:hypothetical protein
VRLGLGHANKTPDSWPVVADDGVHPAIVMIGRVSDASPTDRGADEPAVPPDGAGTADLGRVVAEVSPRRGDDEHAPTITQTKPTVDTARDHFAITTPDSQRRGNLGESQ